MHLDVSAPQASRRQGGAELRRLGTCARNVDDGCRCPDRRAEGVFGRPDRKRRDAHRNRLARRGRSAWEAPHVKGTSLHYMGQGGRCQVPRDDEDFRDSPRTGVCAASGDGPPHHAVRRRPAAGEGRGREVGTHLRLQGREDAQQPFPRHREPRYGLPAFRRREVRRVREETAHCIRRRVAQLRRWRAPWFLARSLQGVRPATQRRDVAHPGRNWL